MRGGTSGSRRDSADGASASWWRVGRLAVVAALTCAAGCFRYEQVPVGRSTPADLDVRVSVDSGARDRITAAVGPRVAEIAGRTVAADDSSVTLSVRSLTRSGGSEETWNGDPVRVPRAAIARIERRRLDPLRTGVVVGGIAAAAILAGHAGTSVPTTGIRGGPSGSGQ